MHVHDNITQMVSEVLATYNSL